MKRTWKACSAAVAALAAGGLAAAEQLPGRWLEGKIAAAGSEREYRIYVPSGYRGTPAPLVVMLHPCGQDPDAFAETTRMNRVAEEAGFLVLYPAQSLTANTLKCWNWFLPDNQRRDAGEPGLIVQTIRQLERQFAVDGRRVYVAGFSAGASMSGVLAACYPDVFAAAAVHSGTMVKSAATLAEATQVMKKAQVPDAERLAADAWSCGGKKPLAVPVMVWQGQDDRMVIHANGDGLVRQFVRINDWADDGAANGSAPQPPSRSEGQAPNGRAWTLDRYVFRGQPLIDYYRIAGMGHAWSGGKEGAAFADPKGPDASRLMWDFFRQHSR